MSIDLISGLIGFLLTVMILSYIIGDGPVFRIAIYIFIGVSAGYVTVVAIYQVLLPGFLGFFDSSASPVARVLLIFPLLLGGLMLMKISPRLSTLGAPATAYIVGVSAAAAVGGAVLGTILPQVGAAAESVSVRNSGGSVINGLIMLVVTVFTLAYFQFGAQRQPDGTIQRNRILETIAWVGGIFVALTLGALFAGVYSAALTALVERVNSLFAFIFSFIGPQ